MTQIYAHVKMHDKTNAMSDTPQALLSQFRDIEACCFD